MGLLFFAGGFIYTLLIMVWCLGVRGFLVSLLNTYRKLNLLWFKITGGGSSSSSSRTPLTSVERRVITGGAWTQYCRTLEAAGASLLTAGCPSDPLNQAEGYRYLSRLVRVSLEVFMECSDRNNPRLVALANGLRDCPVKIGSDNPDNLYQSAMLDARERYVLRGNRGTVFYLGFGTQAGVYGQRGGLKTIMNKEISDMNTEPNGDFQVIISVDPPADPNANWMQLAADPHEALLIVRQTFNDRDTEIPATFELTLDSRESAPSDFSCEQLDEALKTSGLFVAGASMLFARWAHGFQKHVNQLPLFDQEKSNKAGGDPAIRYYHSYWKLKSTQECLVIRSKITPCHTWNFQLNNHWMESLDYRYFPIHTNAHLATYLDDAKSEVVIVISNEKPDTRLPVTWINTVGHLEGTMCFRWIRPAVPDSQLYHPQIDVVPIAEINSFLAK